MFSAQPNGDFPTIIFFDTAFRDTTAPTVQNKNALMNIVTQQFFQILPKDIACYAKIIGNDLCPVRIFVLLF